MNGASPGIPSKRSYLRKLLIKVKTSIFFKNILVVMAGTGIAQVISIGLAPVISRLFTPSDFGIAGSFGADRRHHRRGGDPGI